MRRNKTNPPRNLFDCQPVRTNATRGGEDGAVVVLIPRFGTNVFGRIFQRLFQRPPITLRLDEIGSVVWSLCDGRRTVHEIGGELEERFGDRVAPVYDRLAVYLHQMRRAGIVEW